jgi:hypothetical protein
MMRLNLFQTRLRILALLVVLVLIGIWSRVSTAGQAWTSKSFGDTIWATMFYLLILLPWPRLGRTSTAAFALVITFAIEFLKLCHVGWLDALRAERFAGFLLGHQFYWYDLGFYVLGILAGVAVDIGWIRRAMPTFSKDYVGVREFPG